MNMILGIFPAKLQEISKCFNEEINSNLQELKTLQIQDNNRKDIRSITVKDFNRKLGIEDFDNDNVTKFRKNIQNAKLRNIYFRLINNDFFTRERMLKYKMTTDTIAPVAITLKTQNIYSTNAYRQKIFGHYSIL
jgi:hypothetical protein